jgi:hypothetical protein
MLVSYQTFWMIGDRTPGTARAFMEDLAARMGYDLGRTHKSLENPNPRTPAMAAGIADHVWTCEEIAALLD